MLVLQKYWGVTNLANGQFPKRIPIIGNGIHDIDRTIIIQIQLFHHPY